MNLDDFRYMWRGKILNLLTDQQAYLLKPINIRGQGKDHALLLLHGFSSSPAVYRQLIPTITDYDAIIAPTLPGHGESIAAFTTVKASEWIAAAEQACQELVKNYRYVDVIGLSLGGLLACHLSQRFDVHHLYLLAPALALRLNISFGLKLGYFLQKLGFKSIPNRAGNLYSKLQSELAYRQVPITTAIEILNLINNFKFTPPSCPVDLFLGQFDEVVNTQVVEKMFLDLPNTTIHWLSHSAHVLPLDGDVDTIASCLQQGHG